MGLLSEPVAGRDIELNGEHAMQQNNLAIPPTDRVGANTAN